MKFIILKLKRNEIYYYNFTRLITMVEMEDIRGVRLRKFNLRKIILGVRMHFHHMCHGLHLISARHGIAIPVRTVPANLQRRRTLSTALCDSWRPRCSKMSTINIRQTDLLLRWSGSMELFTGSFDKQYINYRRIWASVKIFSLF